MKNQTEIENAAAILGRAGGKAGKGDSKRRANEHYKTVLVEVRAKNRAARRALLPPDAAPAKES